MDERFLWPWTDIVNHYLLMRANDVRDGQAMATLVGRLAECPELDQVQRFGLLTDLALQYSNKHRIVFIGCRTPGTYELCLSHSGITVDTFFGETITVSEDKVIEAVFNYLHRTTNTPMYPGLFPQELVLDEQSIEDHADLYFSIEKTPVEVLAYSVEHLEHFANAALKCVVILACAECRDRFPMAIDVFSSWTHGADNLQKAVLDYRERCQSRVDLNRAEREALVYLWSFKDFVNGLVGCAMIFKSMLDAPEQIVEIAQGWLMTLVKFILLSRDYLSITS